MVGDRRRVMQSGAGRTHAWTTRVVRSIRIRGGPGRILVKRRRTGRGWWRRTLWLNKLICAPVPALPKGTIFRCRYSTASRSRYLYACICMGLVDGYTWDHTCTTLWWSQLMVPVLSEFVLPLFTSCYSFVLNQPFTSLIINFKKTHIVYKLYIMKLFVIANLKT
jgi:hypothetical protein